MLRRICESTQTRNQPMAEVQVRGEVGLGHFVVTLSFGRSELKDYVRLVA